MAHKACVQLGCGTVAAYRRGCRCGQCKRANAETRRNYVAKRKIEGRPLPKVRGEARRYHLSDAQRLALYERDGWTCQICFKPVDRLAHFNNLMAPTLDHIEPQSLTLIPDHSALNLRTAHRICNARRGNRVEVLAC